jgi:hypothetical protein
MTTLETLKAAREKIADPARWTQDWFAKRIDEDGTFKDTDATSSAAVCWCSSGAIRAVLGVDDFGFINEDFAVPFGFNTLGDLENFNDTHTHPEVLRAFDEAIAKPEAQLTPLSVEDGTGRASMSHKQKQKILDVMRTLITIRDGRANNASVSARACWEVFEEVLELESQ